MTVMSFIILVVALIGVAMLIGPGLVDLILTGIASIEFVDKPFIIVFAVVLVVFFAFCIAWNVIANHKKFAVMRYISWGVFAFMVVVYSIFLCSIWADVWSASYIEFLSKYESVFEELAQTGRFFIFFGLGWLGHYAFNRYIVQNKETVDGK